MADDAAVSATEQFSDDALVAGLAARDPDLAVLFVKRFGPKVSGAAMAVLGNPRIAEDVVQQTFEQTLRHAHAYDPDRGTVRRWVTTIAHNLAVDCARARCRSTPVDPADLTALAGAWTETPEDRALAEETSGEVRAAVARLPYEQGRAVVMAGMYRMTAREVSESERIPLGTAKTRIRLAADRLRASLTRQDERA